jgi:glycosyltransferase involved in cell wall biosynthesis
VRLRAVGSYETPDYEIQIRHLADRLGLNGAIDWRGFSSDVNAELERMDLFVLPSLFGEGLPMVVLEAMAADVPVIATRVEGVPEAVRDGLDGLIAAPGDADDLARVIGQIIDGEADWQALRASAHRRQAEHFSDRSMADGVADVYRRVLQFDE